MMYESLPSLYVGKQNRGNRNRGNQKNHKRRAWTPGQRQFGTNEGAYNLRSLGDGQGSVQWSSDIVPSQFVHGRSWSGERLLMEAVLMDALTSYWRHKDMPGPHAERIAREDRQWLTDNDERYLFSFVNICFALGLDVGAVRAGVLREGRRAA